MSYTNILKPGRNCWRIQHADRVAFLIDGKAYFDALYHSLCAARLDIKILAWDVYSEIRLGALQGDPRKLAQLLDDQLQTHPDLHARILNWDFTLLFAMAREWLPRYKLGWSTHPRLDFRMDKQHPVGGSHHQKVVIVDHQLAFSGGLDITRGRWDTPEHHPDDPRRKQVDDTLGRPHHDVQIAVDGAAARALDDLARERWRRACGEPLDANQPGRALWPDSLPVDLHDVDVAISRTLPAFDDYASVTEVEQLYLDAIAAAEDYIYLENQYYTSPTINRALIERLQENDGPEIIINLSLETDGWLAQNSMDLIRVRLLEELRAADHQQRLAVYYPFSKQAVSSPINLHAKLMFVDDRFVRVGSSNLNNRSMGLDTECDVAIECAPHDERVKQGIADFRDRLLAEHLGCSTAVVRKNMTEHDSVIAAIETLRDNPQRSLKPLQDELPDYNASVLTEPELVDPQEEIDIDSLVYHMLPPQRTHTAARRLLIGLSALALFLLLAAAWRYTPLSEWLDLARITSGIETLNANPLAPLLLIGGFVIAGLFMVPVTLLIIGSVIVFGPFLGFVYALIGATSCALAGYGVGSAVGKESIRGLAGGRIHDISQQLARRGVFTIVVLRIVPVAPFTVINLVAGASHISLKHFFLGTVTGLLPGVTAIALLTYRVSATLHSPDGMTIGLLVAAALIILSSGLLLSRYLMRIREN
jgi:phosphatidylserine/phosphatidylglycerophosphate/cardiolipin synthase-like enzyme/uncharacterized membrane protein YdjX (TVP38/TMEM64 family)